MSTHPNAMLLVLVTPDDVSRKTLRSLLSAAKARGWEVYEGDGDSFKIPNGHDGSPTEECPGGASTYDGYNCKVMEDTYIEGAQISGKEGQIAIWDLVTYGYGDTIRWEQLAAQKERLDSFLREVCDELKFKYEVFISANYW